ncbi:chromosome transmission fidelity protein 1 [Nematocida displodere]|uniref:DNA 5'-3' helicase n=1 Tax=Nematocida displodere TaxID=1805483 RepID=A0A177EHW1_9MICR|nr:chromosome transmission fidelity protein 1 [Nematocida displodere]
MAPIVTLILQRKEERKRVKRSGLGEEGPGKESVDPNVGRTKGRSSETLRLYPGQQAFVRDGIEIVKQGGVGVLESPTGTGKTISSLLVAMDYVKDGAALPEGISAANASLLREMYSTSAKYVIYACRTHEQLDQVVQELDMLNRVTGSQVRGVVLGSRRVTCINPRVCHSENINNLCRVTVKGNRCSFYSNLGNISEKTEKLTISIEDSVKEGRAGGFCPYFFLKKQVHRSNIIILPYSLILQEGFFRDYNIPVESSVLIVDEGHNLYDAVIDEYSISLEISDLESTLSQIKSYLEAEERRNRLEILEVFIFISKIVKYLTSDPTASTIDVNTFLYESELSDANTYDIAETITKHRLPEKISPLSQVNIENRVELCLNSLERFCRIIGGCDKNSYIFRDKLRFQLKSIFPANYLSHLEKLQSVLVVGGTLLPADDIGHLFKRDLVEKKYPSVCQKMSVGICKDFRFTYARRYAEVQKLCNLVLEYSRALKNGGVLVFLQSKEVLRMVQEEVKNRQGTLSHASGKDMRLMHTWLFEGSTTLRHYKDVISTEKTGVLFCVMGGSFSEGVNFSDDLCRVLLVCGIPLPKATNEVLLLTKHRGSSHFINKGMRTINQTIGRAVRKATDYCCVSLLDARFLTYKEKLSSWIHPYVTEATSQARVGESLAKLSEWRMG